MFKSPLHTRLNYLHAWCDSLFQDHSIFRLFWTNLAPVIPGKIWRCNHPTPWRIASLKKRLGLKAMVNLRGKRFCGSDALGRKKCEELELPYYDLAFESRNAPHKDRILRFYELYQKLSFPCVIHCKSGADRTGLVSGLILLFEGGKSEDALKQLHWRFLHFKRSRTGVLDAFFILYRREAEGRIPFIEWVREEYDEEKLRADFRAGRYHGAI